MKSIERTKRSLVKTITYRLIILISTFTITYLLTGEIQLTLGITFFVNVMNTLLYFFHERLWNTISWGKVK